MSNKIILSFLCCIISCFAAEHTTYYNIRRIPGYEESIVIASSQNMLNKTQQDRGLHAKLNNGHLFAIFDGHSGEEVVNHLYNNYENIFSKNSSISLQTMIERYHELDHSMKSLQGGSTACSVYIPKNESSAYFINLGDSKACLINPDGTIAFETNPHCVDTSDQNTIEAKGGNIGYSYSSGSFYIKYNNKSINLSRSFGDFHFKAAELLSVEPDLEEVLLKDDQLLLICSDGFFEDRWDTIPQSIAQAIQEGKNPQDIIKAEVEKAQTISRDDITALLVVLKTLLAEK